MKNFFYHLFVPNEKNNHRALLLKPGFLGILIAFYLLNLSLIKSFTMVKPGVLGYSSEITAQKIFEKTNNERQKLGLPLLHYNSDLSLSASSKAEDMFANNYWAHTSPLGKLPWDFFKQVSYDYSVAGENLAKDFYDSDSAMKAWMKSPTHRENIVNSKYKEIGIGVVNGTLNGVKTTLVVQHFGTPQNIAQISNKTSDEIAFNSHQLNTSVLDPQVLAVQSKIINPLFISKIVGSIIFLIILTVLFIDGIVVIKNKTHRMTGSSTGHVGFLALIFFLMLLVQQGKVF